MGWLFSQGQTKSELVLHLTEGDSRIVTHHHSVRGNRLWCVQENCEQGVVFIAVYLMASHQGYGWGYKPVTESMGPSEVDCPLYMLDAAPVPDSPHAEKWRDRVRAYHAIRRDREKMIRKSSTGDLVLFNDGCDPSEVTLESKKPLLGRCSNGVLYRIPRRMIASIKAR